MAPFTVCWTGQSYIYIDIVFCFHTGRNHYFIYLIWYQGPSTGCADVICDVTMAGMTSRRHDVAHAQTWRHWRCFCFCNSAVQSFNKPITCQICPFSHQCEFWREWDVNACVQSRFFPLCKFHFISEFSAIWLLFMISLWIWWDTKAANRYTALSVMFQNLLTQQLNR